MRFLHSLASGLALTALLACGSSAVRSGGSGGAGGAGSATGTGGTGGVAGTGTSSGGAPPDAGPSCADPPAPEVYELGTGETCFERLTPGQTVTVLEGPQGGYHLWVAIGCSDCTPSPIVQFGAKNPETGEFYQGPLKQHVTLNGDGWRQRAGLTAFLPGVPWEPGSQLPKGTHVLLSATVLESDGVTKVHEAEVEVVLGDVQNWYPPCDTGPNCGQPGALPCCNG